MPEQYPSRAGPGRAKSYHTGPAPLFTEPRKGSIVVEEESNRSIEQVRHHLARAESELQAARRLLDPKTDNEVEMDLVRAVANARTFVGAALETIRARL